MRQMRGVCPLQEKVDPYIKTATARTYEWLCGAYDEADGPTVTMPLQTFALICGFSSEDLYDEMVTVMERLESFTLITIEYLDSENERITVSFGGKNDT